MQMNVLAAVLLGLVATTASAPLESNMPSLSSPFLTPD